ncbi:MAG TPA: DUF2723 domain-containing protein [Ignavibacteriales bacterium]|nr:DUF2723 domain-containing protein [Ignavibacteriales bacterium]
MNFLKRYYQALTALFVFIIYLFTLAPSVVEIDSGELAAVQALAGIAHPTGYPLFTMAGYLLLKVLFPFRTIFAANLLAALWCTLGVVFFMKSASFVLNNLSVFNTPSEKFRSKKEKKDKHHREAAHKVALHKKETASNDASAGAGEINEVKKILSIILGALVLAFSKTFWMQSTSVEVYSLHIFLINLIIYFLLRAFAFDAAGRKHPFSGWIIFSLALALGFSNHMTTLLILPGAAYFYFQRHKYNVSDSYKKIALMLLCFFPLLILIYAYLPIRAAENPVLNWGNPVDLERFLRHVSGKQYQVWLFSSAGAARRQLELFITTLPGEFAIVSLLFVILGIYQAFGLAKKFSVFLVICFSFTVLYSINYDIVDISSYFLLAYISLSFFAVFGVLKVFSILKSAGENPYVMPASLAALFIMLQIYFNLKDVNRSGVYTFEDYTKSVIESTEKNSIIFSYEWDYLIAPAYYLQKVENFRKDAVIIDKELLRRSWYYNQLERNHPVIASRLKPFSEPFLKALQPFERSENFSAELLESLYRTMMTRLVEDNLQDHPFYIAPELVENEMQRGEFSLPRGYSLVPDLFLFKVVKDDSTYVPARNPDFTIRLPRYRDHYINFIENTAGAMLVRRAMYEMKFDKTERAKLYLNKVKKEFPDYQIPYSLEQAFN